MDQGQVGTIKVTDGRGLLIIGWNVKSYLHQDHSRTILKKNSVLCRRVTVLDIKVSTKWRYVWYWIGYTRGAPLDSVEKREGLTEDMCEVSTVYFVSDLNDQSYDQVDSLEFVELQSLSYRSSTKSVTKPVIQIGIFLTKRFSLPHLGNTCKYNM